jgi:DNA-binding LytR/AlgR family response regulator
MHHLGRGAGAKGRQRPWAVVISDTRFIESCLRALDVEFPDAAIARCGPRDSESPEATGVVVALVDGDANVRSAVAVEPPQSDRAMQRFDPRRIADAIRQALDLIDVRDSCRQQSNCSSSARLRDRDHLFDGSGCPGGFVAVDSIVCIRAAAQGTEVRTATGRCLKSANSLNHWEARLPPTDFVRIHRATIVNIRRVDRIERTPEQSSRVFLHGMQEPLVLSRRYAVRLRRQRV